MAKRINISSGGKWEDIVGYSRAVRVGNMVFVAGTTAHTDEGIVGENDAYTQSIYILKKIEKALAKVGANMNDVVQSRIFVVNISRNSDLVGKAHGEFFRTIKPASTMIEVSALVDPKLLVETEVIALVK